MKPQIENYSILEESYLPLYEETYRNIRFTVGISPIAYALTIEVDHSEMCKLLEIDPSINDGKEVTSKSVMMKCFGEIFMTSGGSCYRIENTDKSILYVNHIGTTPISTNMPTQEMVDVCNGFSTLIEKEPKLKGYIDSAQRFLNEVNNDPNYFYDKGEVNDVIAYKIKNNGKPFLVLDVTEKNVVDMCRKFIDTYLSMNTHSSLLNRLQKDLNKKNGGKRNE